MMVSLFPASFAPTRPAMFVFIVCVYSGFFRVAGSNIVKSPETDIIVPLNTTGIFVCIANSSDSDLSWQIRFPGTMNFVPQSYVLDQFDSRGVVLTTTSNTSTLSISGLLKNNNTRVYCIAKGGLTSHEVAFIVFGPPSPPESVYSEVAGPGLIFLSWPLSPAYFSEALTYELKVSKEGNLIDVIPVKENVYEYSFEEKQCKIYRFAVYSVNEAGTSSNSTEVSVVVPTVPDRVTGLEIAVLSLVNNTYSVKLQFMVTGCLDDYPISEYIVSITTGDDSENPLLYNISSMKNDTSGDIVNVCLEEYFLADTTFSITVSVMNEVGTGEPSNEMNFYTSDVQRVIVTLSQVLANVSCFLVNGSDARGCFVSISVGSDGVIERNISHQNYLASDSFLFPVMDTSFSLSDIKAKVFDWEKDGTFTPLSFPVEMILEDFAVNSTPAASGTSNPNSLHQSVSGSPMPTTSLEVPHGPLPMSLVTIVIVAVGGLALIVIAMVTLIIILHQIRRCRCRMKSYAVQDHRSTSSMKKSKENQEIVEPYGVASLNTTHHRNPEPLYQEVTSREPTTVLTNHLPHYQSPSSSPVSSCPHYHVLENLQQPACAGTRQNPSVVLYDEVCRDQGDHPDGNTSPCSSSSSPPPIPPHYRARGYPPCSQPPCFVRGPLSLTPEQGLSPSMPNYLSTLNGRCTLTAECVHESPDMHMTDLESGRVLTPSFGYNGQLCVGNGNACIQQQLPRDLSRARSVDNRPAGWPRRHRSNSDSLTLAQTVSRCGILGRKEHQTLQRTLV